MNGVTVASFEFEPYNISYEEFIEFAKTCDYKDNEVLKEVMSIRTQDFRNHPRIESGDYLTPNLELARIYS